MNQRRKKPAGTHTAGVYVFTCTPTGDKYYGSAKDLQEAERDLRRMLRDNLHDNWRMHMLYQEYGDDAFEFKVIAYFHVLDARHRTMFEELCIKTFKGSLNVRSRRPPPLKMCTRCGRFKPRESFSPRLQSLDGLQSTCDPCLGRERMEDTERRKLKKLHEQKHILQQRILWRKEKHGNG